jgi:hypothetical protein
VGPNHLQALSEDTREGLVSSRRHDLPGLTCAAVMLHSEQILLPYPKRGPLASAHLNSESMTILVAWLHLAPAIHYTSLDNSLFFFAYCFVTKNRFR